MHISVIKFIRGATPDQLADIALELAAIDPPLFEELANRAGIALQARRFNIPGTFSTFVDMTPKQLDELVALCSAPSQKIPGIKWLRTEFKLGLKEAKDLIESMAQDGILKKLLQTPGTDYYGRLVKAPPADDVDDLSWTVPTFD